MEGGFRRLWSRKKSAGASDRSSHQRNVSSRSGATTKSQAILSGRPSMATSQSDRPYSRDRLTGTRDYLTSPAGDDSSRPKTVGRIQPMLVGISRPDTGMERPETAGSFQNAVLRAADSVNPPLVDGSGTQPMPIPPRSKERSSRPSDVSGPRLTPQPMSQPPSQPISKPVSKPASKPASKSTSKPVSVQSQQRDKPSRHVDIFSIATSVPSPLSQYNEEIAERNLDTLRLALENTPYVYNPTSKYQEEVAVRNATLPYKSRTSTDTIPRMADTGRTASLTNRSTRNVASPRPRSSQSYTHPQSYSHSHQPSNASGESSQKLPRERPSQHTRQASQRSQDALRLPVIPQEETHHGGLPEPSHNEKPAHSAYRGLRVMPSVPAYNDEFPDFGGDEMSYDIVPGPSATVTGPLTSNFAAPEVQASTSDYGMQPLHFPAATTRTIEQKTYHDPIYNPAPRSLAQPTRRLEGRHRTFMDLADDEAEQMSETSSPYPASQYSAYSPIVEQAGFDAVQRVLPSQIHTEERRGSRVFDPSTIPNYVPIDPGVTPKAQTPQRQSPRLAAAPPPSSAFSPINTVASWSPRSSLATRPAPPQEPTSMTARVTAILESNKAGANDNTSPVTHKRGDETPTVKERVATLESNSDHGISPATSLTNLSSDNGKNSKNDSAAMLFSRAALAPLTDTQAPSSSAIATKTQAEKATGKPTSPRPEASPSQTSSKPTAHKDVPAGPTQSRTAKTTSKTTSTPNIHTSPESIKSADYVNPSDTFGIRTRDFAVTPLKGTQSSVEVPTVKQFSKQQAPSKKARSVKARTTQNTPAPSRSKDTGFDEEAFARKRAEAQAAIERLKESLNENFMLPPERATVKNTTIVEEEPEPAPAVVAPLVAPAVAVSPEQRISTVVPAIQRPESEKLPPSSYRNSRGEQNRTSMASSSRSLSTGSRSSRRAPAPQSLRNVEPAAHPIDQKMLSPALLQALSITSTAPKSPGEISLSSFPVPSSSRPPSQPDAVSGYHSHQSSYAAPYAAPYPQYPYTASHSHHNSFAGQVKRRNSTKSQISNISAFSIPFHMVPGRTSSVKDPLPEEGDMF